MVTNELKAYSSLPDEVKPAVLALSVLINRIGSLPKADRDDLFELLQEWRKADDPEEQASIQRAMEEILAQIPMTAKPLSSADELHHRLRPWAKHVGVQIRELRTKADLTQAQLAERAGLPQSHVSRIENAQHTATNMTLEKIAKALGVEIGAIDPCAE